MRKIIFFAQALAVIIATLVFSVAVMVSMALAGKRVFYPFARSWSKTLLIICGVRVKIVGLERLTNDTARVYVCNHQSLFDIPILLASLPDGAAIMYKRELEKIPFLGWCLKASPFIAVTREDPRNAAESIEQAAASIRKGGSVIIFPEGTRSSDGTLGAFRRGAVAVALRAGNPIAPLCIDGSGKILPKKALAFNPGMVRLKIAEQVNPPEAPDRAVEKKLTNQLHAIIQDMLSEK